MFKVINYFKLNDDQELAYSQAFAKQNKKKIPGVVFLSGLKSDMEGTKAVHLHRWALQKGISFLRFDYRGHGNSSGSYEDTSLTDWFEDTKKIILNLTTGPQILVGSSLGGWLSLLFAEKYPEKVYGIVGIAAAPDFTERYKEENLNKTAIMSHVRHAARPTIQFNASSTPKVVATPLPPLNPSHTGKLCPSTEPSAAPKA